MDYIAGLDLGQANDYSTLAIVQRKRVLELANGHYGKEVELDAQYDCGHLQRFELHTPYPRIVEQVKERLDHPRLKGKTQLVVDATGVGRPVVDLLRDAGLRPIAVTITGGDRVSREGDEYRVPKRDLVGVLQVLFQARRLHIASSLPLAGTLIQELLAFKVKISLSTAHDSYGAWREGVHDDLVLAVSLATWWPEHNGPFQRASKRGAYGTSIKPVRSSHTWTR